MILDCAKNVDIRDLKNKINSCLKIEKFEAFKTSQGILNQQFDDRSKETDESLKNFQILIEMSQGNIDKIMNDMEQVKDRQAEVITQDDLNELRERIEVKADKLDLIKMYDLKANKLDITSLTKTLDELHNQIQCTSKINVSILKTLTLEAKNKESEELKSKNRHILLTHASQLSNYICDFKLGDAQVNKNKFENEHMSGFKDFAEHDLQDVKKLLATFKEVNL